MPDLDFSYRYVHNNYAAVVQRAAVLYTLTGGSPSLSGGKQDRPDDIVMQKTRRLQTMWRARTAALTASGWEPYKTAMELTFTRNCCPSFVYAEPRTRPCNLRRICPFCYARWVRQVWERIDAAFPNPKRVEGADADNRSEFGYHLLEQYHTVTKPYDPGDGRSGPDYLFDLLKQLSIVRRPAVERMGALAAFSFTTVEPVAAGWRMRQRRLFKVPAAYIIPEGIEVRTDRHEKPNRRTILQVVARVCRYPIPLVTGDPDFTVRLLEVRKLAKVQMYGMYGGFRRIPSYKNEQIPEDEP